MRNRCHSSPNMWARFVRVVWLGIGFITSPKEYLAETCSLPHWTMIDWADHSDGLVGCLIRRLRGEESNRFSSKWGRSLESRSGFLRGAIDDHWVSLLGQRLWYRSSWVHSFRRRVLYINFRDEHKKQYFETFKLFISHRAMCGWILEWTHRDSVGEWRRCFSVAADWFVAVDTVWGQLNFYWYSLRTVYAPGWICLIFS